MILQSLHHIMAHPSQDTFKLLVRVNTNSLNHLQLEGLSVCLEIERHAALFPSNLLRLLKYFSPCSFLKSFSDIVTGRSSSPTGGWMLTLKWSSFVLQKRNYKESTKCFNINKYTYISFKFSVKSWKSIRTTCTISNL